MNNTNIYYPDKLADATTLEGMRTALFAVSRQEPVVRNAMNVRDTSGLSGEDTYTLIAYHAMKMMMELRNDALRHHELSVNPIFITNGDINP